MLIVTAGVGLVQRDGTSIEGIRPGDVVRFESGEKHWLGASTTGMTHIAIQEALDSKAVEWMEQVGTRSTPLRLGDPGFETGLGDQNEL